MTIMKVIRDNSGKVINIGDWDYQKHVELNSSGEEEEITGNPLPDEVSISDEEVVVGWDGGLYAADDPRKDGN